MRGLNLDSGHSGQKRRGAKSGVCRHRRLAVRMAKLCLDGSNKARYNKVRLCSDDAVLFIMQRSSMTETHKKWIIEQPRFKGIFDTGKYKNGRFEKGIPLASPIGRQHSRKFINEALDAGGNGIQDGVQIGKFEKELAEYMGIPYAVALRSGEAALQLALKLAAEKLYGSSTGIYTPNGLGSGGALCGKKVFCPDLAASDMINPVVFEGGEPVFIDSSDRNWGMDPQVLELAFQKYPDVKLVILNHPYGFPGQVMEVRKLCFGHGALLIECAGEALGAAYWTGQGRPDTTDGTWGKAGALGDYTVLDFGSDKIVGPTGGALLTRNCYEAEKARYWASGAKAAVPWNQHEELGCSFLMGELDAASLRGQLLHIDETIEKKKKIYQRYYDGLDGHLAYVIPVEDGTRPNYWMTAMTCESNIQFMETRSDRDYTYQDIHGTAAPMEIYDALMAFHISSRPVYKPMSMQPVFRNNEHFTLDGPWRMYECFYNDTFWLRCDMARQYYESGICLPSDASMTEEEQDRVIDVVLACYNKADMDGK